jgi:hypothetical protein
MLRLAMAVMCLLALLPASPASASTRNKIIRDCADDGVLQGKYSPSALRDARQNLPSDVAEYTDCADVLRRAELPNTSSGSGGSGSGGSGAGSLPGGGSGSAGGGAPAEKLTPSNETERKALAEAATTGASPVEVNGQKVVPGAAGFAPHAARNGLPDSLLFAILALTLLGLLGLGYAVRDKLPFAGPRSA